MSTVTTPLPTPTNHVFVDYENVQGIDLTVIGSKAVRFTLLLGPQQTKLDVAVVEKLLEHPAATQLVRLTSAGKNALDFALTYYVGRAVAADPGGWFHIVSRDKGYDPLVEHLRSKQIRVRRHDDFGTLTLTAPAKSASPAPLTTGPKPKAQLKPKPRPATMNEREAQVLEHFRKPCVTRPGNKARLVSYLVAHFGNTISEAEALDLVKYLSQAGHLIINEKDTITYYLEAK